jgi:tetratricopeptide (TPR) repeat protein
LWKADGTPETDTPELVKVLEGILRRHPQHPGANHYYIHAVEASPTPDRAMASATRLETLVPGAGHLVHMPTHIYIHTGQIDRVAELNAKAARADERYIELAKPEGVYQMYYNHNVHFVVVGSILIGRYEDAAAAATQMTTIVEPHLAHIGPQMEWAVGLGLLTDIRFHKWDRILTAPRPGADRPLTRAFDHYARALAYHSTGKRAEAAKEAAQFDVARKALAAETVIGMFNPAGTVLEMTSHLLAGQLASNTDEAVAHLENAVAAQDAFRYDEPEPWPWSVRETLGAVLIKAGRYPQAEKVFRVDLEKNPGSGRALFGLLTSLEAQQKSAEAALIRREFERAWAKATSPLSVEALF